MLRKRSSVLFICLAFVLSQGLCYHAPTYVTGTPDSTMNFTFHYNSVNYQNDNRSIIIFNGADLQGPKRTDAFEALFRCNVKQVQSGITFWVGSVAWVTDTVKADAHVSGDVDIRCWMSSTDDVGFLGSSGYGVGIAEGDEKGNIVWYKYEYRYTIAGKAIANDPNLYSLTIKNVDHVFPKGHKIGFVVAAGCTKQGWGVKVYFDSPDKDSHATLFCDQFLTRLSSSISCSISQSTVDIGSRVTISGAISPAHVAVVTLAFTKPDGSVFSRTVTTSSEGMYSYSLDPDQIGFWSVEASWQGDSDYNGATSLPTSFTALTTTTTTTTTPTIISGKLEYLQGQFKFGSLTGAWIRVVVGMDVEVEVKIKVVGFVQGPLRVEVKKDVVEAGDNIYQVLTKDISLSDGEYWVDMGTFNAKDQTNPALGSVREYFIKVYSPSGECIHNSDDPVSREWVKTYAFSCYAVYDASTGKSGATTQARYGEKIWIQTFLTADGSPVANREMRFIVRHPDGTSYWFWTDGTNAQGFCHKDWTIGKGDLDKGSYMDFTVELHDRYFTHTGLIIYGEEGTSGYYLGSYTARVNILW